MSIVENIKSIATLIQKADNIELYQKILNIQSEALDLINKNRELTDENRNLSEKLEIKDQLRLNNSAYWIGDENDGPFCTRCWDADKKLIRLHPSGNPAYYGCPDCKCGTVKAKPELDKPQDIRIIPGSGWEF